MCALSNSCCIKIAMKAFDLLDSWIATLETFWYNVTTSVPHKHKTFLPTCPSQTILPIMHDLFMCWTCPNVVPRSNKLLLLPSTFRYWNSAHFFWRLNMLIYRPIRRDKLIDILTAHLINRVPGTYIFLSQSSQHLSILRNQRAHIYLCLCPLDRVADRIPVTEDCVKQAIFHVVVSFSSYCKPLTVCLMV